MAFIPNINFHILTLMQYYLYEISYKFLGSLSNNLLDKLLFHTSKPLASLVVGRTHLEGLKVKDMSGYLNHHLDIAGVAKNLFADEAVLATHQGSGGLPRGANALARGALIATAIEKLHLIIGENVRLAATEII